MEARNFNSIMYLHNEEWVAKILNAKVNSSRGLDVIGKDFGMEVKFTLVGKQCNAQKYPRAWTVNEYQTKYQNENEMYWGFGTYSLSKSVEKINKYEVKNLKKIEKIVLERELWILPWNFLKNHERHETQGKSKMTNIKWHSILIYPKLKEIPTPLKTFEVEKGRIHFAEGINLELFSHLK